MSLLPVVVIQYCDWHWHSPSTKLGTDHDSALGPWGTIGAEYFLLVLWLPQGNAEGLVNVSQCYCRIWNAARILRC